ncbi:MAG: hypothetical protein J2O48_05560, partial [Solirubrobacterales bacterium]|nr:hypothetical protein [Solirubrobacterales bacterium]
MPRHTVVIPIYPDVTQLDFTGPSQAFIQVPDLELIVASVGGRDVASADLTFTSLAKLEDIERCDVLCVPGGDGCLPAAEDPVYMAAIRRLAGSARYI